METWLAAAALIVGIAAIVVAYWLGLAPRKLARRDLEKTRSLKIELNGTDADECVWVLPWNDYRAFMVDFEITLTNEGNLSVEDVVIEVDLPSITYIPEIHREPGGAAKLVGVQRETDAVDDTERTKLFYKVPAVHPSVAVRICDYMFLPTQSRVKSTVEATTKDGVPVCLGYEAVLGFAVRLSAQGRDVHAASGNFKILSFDPLDKLLEPLADRNGVFARLAKILKQEEKPEPVPALLLVAEQAEPAAGDVQKCLGLESSLGRVRLSDVRQELATHYGAAGYLPITAHSIVPTR